jgi:hypothetical protein
MVPMAALLVRLGLDLTVHAPSVPVNVNVLVPPLFGLALVNVPEALPVQVWPLIFTLMLLIVRLTEVLPLIAVGADTVHGRTEVMAVQAELPLKLAAVTFAVPLVTVNVKEAVHGTGLPNTVAVVGPLIVAEPLPLPPTVQLLMANADGAANELATSNAAMRVDLTFSMIVSSRCK